MAMSIRRRLRKRFSPSLRFRIVDLVMRIRPIRKVQYLMIQEHARNVRGACEEGRGDAKTIYHGKYKVETG